MAKIPSNTFLTGFQGPTEKTCFSKDIYLRLKDKYSRQLYPVCPILQVVIGKEKPSIPKVPKTNLPLLNSIIKILVVFEGLMQLRPNLETVVRCAHTEYFLKDWIDLIQEDLSALSQGLEKDFPDTSKNCEELVAELELAEFRYTMNGGLLVYFLPDDMKYGNYLTFIEWRKRQICQVEHNGFLDKIEMNRLTCHYPAEAIKVIKKIYDKLRPLVKILSEQVTQSGRDKIEQNQFLAGLLQKQTETGQDQQQNGKKVMELKPDLNKIATQVEDILVNYPKARGEFKKNVQVFARAFEKYYEAKSNEPQPYDDKTGKKKKKGFEYDKDHRTWFPVNAPQLPPNPTKWHEMKDKRPCYYTALALIHDLEKSKYTNTVMPDEIKGLKHYSIMVGFIQRYLSQGYEPYTQDGLDTALKQVKADLRDNCQLQKPAGTGLEHDNENNGFVKKFNTWEIFYEGKLSPPISGELIGMKCLIFLIKNQGDDFTHTQIINAARNNQFDLEKLSPDEAMDEGLTIRNTARLDSGEILDTLDNYGPKTCRQAIERLELDKEQTDDPAKKLEIQEKIDKIQEHLKRSTNIFGSPRKVADPKGNDRSSVYQRIDNVLDKIKPHHKPLWQHLFDEMRKTGYKSYRPNPSVKWKFPS